MSERGERNRGVVVIEQPGVYNISVVFRSQHLPGERSEPVEITVTGKGNFVLL